MPLYSRYYTLGDVTRTEHLVDDVISNTYRALRYVGTSGSGSNNTLYAEFTDKEDWNFTAPIAGSLFIEMYELDSDPVELDNLASKASAEVKAALHATLVQAWECAGPTCQ